MNIIYIILHITYIIRSPFSRPFSMWRCPEMGVPPNPFYVWIFHSKPSILTILGYPHLWNPPCVPQFSMLLIIIVSFPFPNIMDYF